MRILVSASLCLGSVLSSCGGAQTAPAAKPPGPPPEAGTDETAAYFNDPRNPHEGRLAALRALRSLRDRDPGESRRAYDRVKDRLWIEASLADGLTLSDLERQAFVEAIGWLADAKDPRARLKIELYLDRETVKRKRLPEGALSAAALGLANYPESESARETLWAALKDPKELPAVRSACLQSLRAHHPKDLFERVGRIEASPGDDWMRDLQRRLR